MTREEEIRNKADELGQKYFPDEYNICARENIEAQYVSFACIEMAKWVDKHPKRYSQGELCDIQEEMMRQRDKRLIEKTYKWLENYAELTGIDYETIKESFNKAMEE